MKSNYIGLWLLLAGALAIFLVFSFVESSPVIGAWEPKKAPFRETLLAVAPEQPDTVPAVSAEELAEALSVDNPTDTTAQSIFLFGDSMTLNLAHRLAAYARQNGHEFHAVNWDSSNTKIWAESDTLAYYLDKYQPTQVFIALGSNELYLPKPEKRLPCILRIVDMIGNIPYVWIGPPSLKVDGGLNDVLANNLPQGSFFLSSGLELARKKDKIHPTRDASALWIDSVMRWLPRSSHPFLAEVPADSVAKGNPHTVLLKALNK